MSVIRLATSSDREIWEQYVGAHRGALLGHAFFWRDFIAETQKITPCYWLAEEAGKVAGIAPFFLRQHPVLGKRLTSLPYLNTGGLLADNPAIQADLWAVITDWAREHGVKSLELRNRYTVIPGFASREGRSVSVIPLGTDEKSTWDNLKSVARNRIRKAQNAGLTALHGFDYLDGFWRAYAENMLVLGAPVLSRRWFERLADGDNAHMIVIQQGGVVIAGMVLLHFKDGTENAWTGSTLAARDVYANDLLYWEAARWAVGRGMAWLDLGRSEAGGSHEHFKEKFGAVSSSLPYQEMERHGEGWVAVTHEPAGLYQAFRTVWERLPLPLATLCGPYFSRQIY